MQGGSKGRAMTDSQTAPTGSSGGPDLRYRAGIALLTLSVVCPLIAIPVAYTSLPTAVKGTIMGLLTVGAPEVFTLLAVAVLGKENFNRIKLQVLGKLKALKPAPASRGQYYVGLCMMLLPIIPTYIMAYAPSYLPDQSPQRLYVSIASDLIFVIGAFVAGGDMWDKMRALFVYDARVEFAPPSQVPGTSTPPN